MIYDPLTEEESFKTNGVMLNGHTDFNSIRLRIFPQSSFRLLTGFSIQYARVPTYLSFTGSHA